MNKKSWSKIVFITFSFLLLSCNNTTPSDILEPMKTEQVDSNRYNIDFSKEPYEVLLCYISDEQEDAHKIEEEINKILLKEFNATLKLKSLNYASIQDELSFMLSDSSKIDLFPILVHLSSSYVYKNEVVNLTQYINNYGTNIKNALGDRFSKIANINGFTYGVTTKREWVTQMGIMMREDILNEAGFTKNDINSLQDLDIVYKEVYNLYPNMVMLASSQESTPLGRWEMTDMLSDKFGVLMEKGQSTTVVNLYETDDFKNTAEIIYNWNNLGYIARDAATTTNSVVTQIGQGKAFSYITPIKSGGVEQDELQTGYDLTISPLNNEPYITSYSVNFLTWGVAKNSKDPLRSFLVLDYIYGSSEIMNLLNWGIESEHYVFADKEKGIIKYPPKTNELNKKYGLNIGWQLPNQFISYTWEGNNPDIWFKMQEEINNATLSKALGFNYDSTPVEDKLAALRIVNSKYFDAIGSGSVNPETEINKFNEELYKAGLQDVIDEKQRQLDIWLKEKNN